MEFTKVDAVGKNIECELEDILSFHGFGGIAEAADKMERDVAHPSPTLWADHVQITVQIVGVNEGKGILAIVYGNHFVVQLFTASGKSENCFLDQL
jgi:hypothetical protein